MLFNSYVYLFLFLPITCIVYYTLAPRFHTAAKIWLSIASLFFYGWWNAAYVPLLLASCAANFMLGKGIGKSPAKKQKKTLLVFGIASNLLMLCYFKYADFLIDIADVITGKGFEPLSIVLPLAISFFTFQQIAYLVDCYKSVAKEYDALNYLVFVSFFPHLIAGPVIHHSEMMPQFYDRRNGLVNPVNITLGLLLFSFGLFKKVVLADTYATWATQGFDGGEALSLLEAWGTSFSYTFQLYFDFSGYTDMALGSALLLNIRLPFKFASPYKSLSIQDFWRRWHMTLSRFLRDYIYIPLGGSKTSEPRVLWNLLVTFFLGGLWHGAGWTFVIWGLLHGAGMVIQRVWQKIGIVLPIIVSWALTFLFINLAWVVFRAENMADAGRVFRGMTNFAAIEPVNILWLLALASGFVIVLFLPNTNAVRDLNNPRPILSPVISGFLIFISILVLEVRKTSEFLYFQF